jgi:hypothetical protein
MSLRLVSILTLAVFVCPGAVFAQTAQPPADAVAPAHVAYVEGSATLEREGRPETAPLNMPLLSGDRLKTLSGRVEVLFGDGSALHMDSQTTVDLQSDDLVRLIDGRVRLAIAAIADQANAERVAYRVDSPAGSVRVVQPGEYRLAILRRGEETQLELAVLRGSAEIFTDEGTTIVRAGERAYASAGLAPSYAYAYNSANWDSFDRWSESRRDARLGVSTQYLPSEVRAYASTFDEDGDWRYQQSYGYVWYPRVSVGWRPYYYGRWAQYPRYGWTWIGADRFAWPTHHYGRWGFSAGAWFWIPASRWAPAYVSWAYAPGYVSWCPLGFDNRPVIAVNIFNARPGYYSSWRAWTAVGYSHFGRGYVHQRAVDWDRYDRARRPSFQLAHSAPSSRDVAMPRSTPIRWAGSRALPAETGSHTAPRDRTWRPPSGGSSSPSIERAAAGGSSDAPRYINRGEDIVRSRSGRPSAPAQPTTGVAVPRNSTEPRSVTNDAERRTIPSGPARRIDVPDERTRIGRDAGIAYSPRSPYERGSVTPRADAPAYQPQPRTYERYDGGRAAPRASPSDPMRPGPDAAGQPAPDPGPRAYARPRPSTGAQGAPGNAEGRGGFESRPPAAGGGAVERQAPAPRAMPAPERSAPSGGTAVPRESGPRASPGAQGAPGRAEGRSAPPAGTPSGARSPRGRGGV